MTDRPLSEKERVYQELALTRRKVGALKREVKALRQKDTMKQATVLRREADAYRQALSNILYRLDNGGVTDEDLRKIVTTALLLRGLKRWRREGIAALRGATDA